MLLGILESPEVKIGEKKCMKTKIETLGYSSDIIFHKGTKVRVGVKSCHELKQVKKNRRQVIIVLSS